MTTENSVPADRDEWVACSCVAQDSEDYCSMGCEIPKDMGCYKSYTNAVGSCPAVNATGSYNGTCSTSGSNTTNAANSIGCWLTNSSNTGDKTLQRNISEMARCWIAVDEYMVNQAGYCRPRAGTSQQYCDETGCFTLGNNACPENWWNPTTE